MLTNEEKDFKNLKIFKPLKNLLFGAVLGLALFSFNPISAYAAGGALGGGGSSEGDSANKPENNIDDEAVELRMAQYCTFWSDGVGSNGANYADLDKFDTEASPKGYAPLVDTTSSGDEYNTPIGRSGAEKKYSEEVMEYEGYYTYEIKLSVFTETETTYKSKLRTYYKYYELKQEYRQAHPISRNAVFGNETDGWCSTGIWLYFDSNSRNVPYVNDTTLVDVFTGLTLEDGTPYTEELFCWVLSSEGIAVAGDEYSTNSGKMTFADVKAKFADIKIDNVVIKNKEPLTDLRVDIPKTSTTLPVESLVKDEGAEAIKAAIKELNATRNINDGERLAQIKAHSSYSYKAISDPKNFELVYFSRRATRDIESGDYDWDNKDCPLVIMEPDENKLIAKIVQLTGHLEYASSPYTNYDYWHCSKRFKYLQDFPCLGIKTFRSGKNSIIFTNTRYTYKDLKGNEWPTWYIRKAFSLDEFKKTFVDGSHRIIYWMGSTSKWNDYLKKYGLEDKYGYSTDSTLTNKVWRIVTFDHNAVNNVGDLLGAGSLEFLKNASGEYVVSFGHQSAYYANLENIGSNDLEHNSTSDYAIDNSLHNYATKEEALKATSGGISGNSLLNDYCHILRENNRSAGAINKDFWNDMGMDLISIKGTDGATREYGTLKNGYPKMTLKDDGDGVKVPREYLRLFQMFYKSRMEKDGGEFVRYVRDAVKYTGKDIICDGVSWNGKFIDENGEEKSYFSYSNSSNYYPKNEDFNKMIENGEIDKVLAYYAVMFAASCEYIVWKDYASDCLPAEAQGWNSGGYSSFPTVIMPTTVKDGNESRILLGNTKTTIDVVDLYKAFNVNKDDIFNIAKIYKEALKNSTIVSMTTFKNIAGRDGITLNISDEKLQMILSALNGCLFEGILTESEIENGKITNVGDSQNINILNDSNDEATILELETSFVPYVVIVRKYSNSEYADTENLENLENFELPEYTGDNAGVVIDSHLKYLKEKEKNEYLAVVQKTGAILFDQMFTEDTLENELFIAYSFGKKIPEMRECLRQFQNEIMTEEGAAMLKCISRTIPSS